MYRVSLEEFEGPLDLLLFFIRRDEIDIYDIPISRIADEFLAYVRVLEQVDLDGVGDFIYMSALLISIKAQMLLPTPPVDEEGEPIDPRKELVERLLEYVRFKEASQVLAGHQDRRSEHFVRGVSEYQQAEIQVEPRLALSVFDLVTALRRVLTTAPPEPVHEVQRFDYTIEMQQAFLLDHLTRHRRQGFVDLVTGRPKGFIIATFLAVLELARQARLQIVLRAHLCDFTLVYREDAEPASGDGLPTGAVLA